LLCYTYLHAQDVKEFKGNILPYGPHHTLNLNLQYKLQDNLRTYIEGSLIGERYTNRENTEKLPAYSLIGTGFTYKPVPNIETFVRVENLLDVRYENINGYPMPGITIRGGVDIAL
ncbi:TonB-dependent receptor, partial [Candidatus Aerophobetes bacterium]|nr:TonB-dependent receptor [Candidatus Aerophobetes bacterium]